MRFKIRNHLKGVILVLVFVFLYNEHLIYYFQTLKWPSLKCTNQQECVKLLLVADPQILGEPSEGQLLPKIYYWDGDRYLRKTYARAVAHTDPDAVLFLGDLTNDGSIASREEFYRYVKRLSNIFYTEYPIKHVWLPGDNDIGGENEPIKPEKVKMFTAAFKQPGHIDVNFVDVYKANYLMQYMPEPLPYTLTTNRTRIVISHMPLLINPRRYAVHVITKIRPMVIFSGHLHVAQRLTATIDSLFNCRIDDIGPKDSEKIFTVDLKQEEMTEFIVPTSSYRLEVMNIGYGMAYVDGQTNKLHYTVLWSPQRFFQLKVYFITISSCIVYLFLILLYKALSVTRAFRYRYPSRV